ncbi:MAG TPA: CHAD domain-containing protein [Usitatibacter sp.]|nr:CHAD domain-containing protein [Usitatibacter sp.]
MAEVELKFEVPVGAHARFRRLELLRGVRAETARMHAVYFDTARFELRERQMSLRLRRARGRWVQSLKAGRSGAGGLHSREECELDRPEGSLDLSAFPRLPPLGAPLEPIFEVDVVRTTWVLEPRPGDRVEVALDRGEVTRAGAKESVSELEIESLSGDTTAIFDLAERMVELAPMRPSRLTKAERGYRLARGEAAAPVRARPAPIHASMAVHEAASSVIASALDQLQANDGGVLTGQDVEYLHQARVAVRRLRSALGVFHECFGEDFAEHARAELAWLSDLTGPVRDWDVLAVQTLPPLVAAFGRAAPAMARRLRARRSEATALLREGLESPRYARLVLHLARFLANENRPAARSSELPGFAVRVARKRTRRLLARSAHLPELAAAQRHALRLDAKRLRYAVEPFAPLFRRKRVARFIDALSNLQEALGRANDAAVAGRLLAQLRPPAALEQFARGWFAGRLQSSLADLERHRKSLAAASDFWKEA